MCSAQPPHAITPPPPAGAAREGPLPGAVELNFGDEVELAQLIDYVSKRPCDEHRVRPGGCSEENHCACPERYPPPRP